MDSEGWEFKLHKATAVHFEKEMKKMLGKENEEWVFIYTRGLCTMIDDCL